MLEDSLPGAREDRHPLSVLAKKCLNNNPSIRPTAEDLVTTIREVKATIKCPHGMAIARVDAVKEVLMVRALGKGYTELDVASSELMMKLEEMQVNSTEWI